MDLLNIINDQLSLIPDTIRFMLIPLIRVVAYFLGYGMFEDGTLFDK